jgi:hypothetical protein
LFCLCPQIRGDVLELKDGTVVQGTYSGGTAGTIRFETVKGVQVIARNEALALTFTTAASPTHTPQVADPATPQGPVPAQPEMVTLPAGTLLLVRTETPVSSSDSPGKRFGARLETGLAANGRVIANAGTKVYGRVEQSEQAGRLAGKSALHLSLTELNINGQVHPIVTSNYAEAGQGSFRKTARNAGLGAALGAAFDGSEGAKKGAAIGGAVSLLRKGQSVNIPVNALLEFRLTQSVTITVN